MKIKKFDFTGYFNIFHLIFDIDVRVSVFHHGTKNIYLYDHQKYRRNFSDHTQITIVNGSAQPYPASPMLWPW